MNKNIFDQGKGSYNHVLNAAINQRKKDNYNWGWLVKSALVIAMVVGLVSFFNSDDTDPHIVMVNHVIKKSGLKSKWLSFTGTKNILFLGVDSNGRKTDPFFGTRSDTIILVSIEKDARSVNAISIPRDSKVFLSKNKGADKINSAHAIGGPNLTVKTIEESFGVEVNNYVVVNYSGIKDFVKAIGGVPINVEKRMYYRDRTAGLTIDLQPGQQVLDADEAEGYLRFRHDEIGDIGRIQRQQHFVKAVIKRLKSRETILKAPELMEVFSKNIRTDLNLFEISKLMTLVGKVNLQEIKVATLPGAPSQTGIVSYWILDSKKTQDVINRLIYRDIPKEEKSLN